jgi:hypothetical protein
MARDSFEVGRGDAVLRIMQAGGVVHVVEDDEQESGPAASEMEMAGIHAARANRMAAANLVGERSIGRIE